MQQEPIHILTKMGVLQSFSIAKKITQSDIDEMVKVVEKEKKSENEVVELVKAKILGDILDASKNGKLPGLILPSPNKNQIPVQNLEFLNRMVLLLTDKFKSKKIDRFSLCYFVNYLVGSLGLSEEDFEDFHRRVHESQQDDGEESC